MEVKTMAEYAAAGETPEVLFWIGCAGSFDQKAQNVTRTFVKILNHLNIKFAVLGTEESCTGDPAKRAGNEFVYQMLALQNIEVMNGYGVKTIVTTCPHCFNIIKNEYPSLGGNYKVIHHSTFLQNLINEGKFKLSDSTQFKGKKITYHDSCYLGRANNIYEAPRAVLETLDADLVEMNSCRSKGLCCGAGGAQVFKEEEHGSKRINVKRTEEALETKADYIATACPYCNIMMSDGVKANDKQDDVKVIDIVELFASGHGLA
ncbi:MAG: CoB--CoM heterodisulfide reductase [Bacteroidetes bacterium 37-13]|nr:MAG: CoB--CoM heterodisulfide reductase [Bacteroidetes bacterium 37-13]